MRTLLVAPLVMAGGRHSSPAANARRESVDRETSARELRMGTGERLMIPVYL